MRGQPAFGTAYRRDLVERKPQLIGRRKLLAEMSAQAGDWSLVAEQCRELLRHPGHALGNDDEELRLGARALARKVRRMRPAAVAFLGIGAYRTAFGRPRAVVGLQPERLEGADVWVLPNPSGRTAYYLLPALVRHFRALRKACLTPKRPRPPRRAGLRSRGKDTEIPVHDRRR